MNKTSITLQALAVAEARDPHSLAPFPFSLTRFRLSVLFFPLCSVRPWSVLFLWLDATLLYLRVRSPPCLAARSLAFNLSTPRSPFPLFIAAVCCLPRVAPNSRPRPWRACPCSEPQRTCRDSAARKRIAEMEISDTAEHHPSGSVRHNFAVRLPRHESHSISTHR